MAAQRKKRKSFFNEGLGALVRAITPLKVANSIQNLPRVNDVYDYTGGLYPYVTPPKTTRLTKDTKERHSKASVHVRCNEENQPSEFLASFDGNNYLSVPLQSPQSEVTSSESVYDLPYGVENEEKLEYYSQMDGLNLEMTGNRSFFRVNRRNAELMLLRPNIQIGTFLLRPCSKDEENSMALSIKSSSDMICHLKIDITVEGKCKTEAGDIFPNMDSLLSYFSENPTCESWLRLMIPYSRKPVAIELDDIAVAYSEIQILDQIGGGNFGDVFKGSWKSLEVAIKQLKPSQTSSQTAILEEAKTMAAVLHENLVKLIAVSIEKEPFLIITEYMNLGSLLDCLHGATGITFLFSFQHLFDILRQIASGMAYLEAEKFLHRDLRAANCLVHQETPQSSLEIKIGDFGLSAALDQDNAYVSHSDKLVPVRWTAPEALLYKRFSNKSDVWSFGILAFEVFSLGALPYDGKNNFELWRFIDSGGRISLEDIHKIQQEPSYLARIEKDDPNLLCSNEIYANLMAKCWLVEPAERPSFRDVVSFIIDYEIESVD